MNDLLDLLTIYLLAFWFFFWQPLRSRRMQ